MCARRGLLLRKVTGEYVNILSVLMHCVTGRIFLRDKHEKKASKIEILASAKRNARLFDHLSHIFPLEKGHRLRSVHLFLRLTGRRGVQVGLIRTSGNYRVMY